MESFVQGIQSFLSNMSGNPLMIISVIFSVLIMTAVYFYFIRFLLVNNSKRLVIVFVISMVVAGLVLIFNSRINNLLFLIIPVCFLMCVLILYSVELKRIIWAKKTISGNDSKHDGGVYDDDMAERAINEIIKAVQGMSKNDVGAIIVLSNRNVPSQVLDSGVSLESDISSELIESVFFPKTPLHDGAMIISGTKIVSAGCFLPLSQNINNIPKDLGTRHRAGLGITETIDVVSIIVSEETGVITIAKAGKMTRYADTEMLRKTLKSYYWQDLNR